MTAMTPDKVEAALGAIQPAIDRLHRYAAHELADKLAEARVVLTEALAESRRDAARLDYLERSLIAADFAYGEDDETEGESVLIFSIPRKCPVKKDVRWTLDAAMKEAP